LYSIKEKKERRSKLLSSLTLSGLKKRNNPKALMDFLRSNNPHQYPKGGSLIISSSLFKVCPEGNNRMPLFGKPQLLPSIS
jgi:hypothetical protein